MLRMSIFQRYKKLQIYLYKGPKSFLVVFAHILSNFTTIVRIYRSQKYAIGKLLLPLLAL
jgi:hypothetical protein